jgi:hypothetical protein
MRKPGLLRLSTPDDIHVVKKDDAAVTFPEPVYLYSGLCEDLGWSDISKNSRPGCFLGIRVTPD